MTLSTDLPYWKLYCSALKSLFSSAFFEFSQNQLFLELSLSFFSCFLSNITLTWFHSFGNIYFQYESLFFLLNYCFNNFHWYVVGTLPVLSLRTAFIILFGVKSSTSDSFPFKAKSFCRMFLEQLSAIFLNSGLNVICCKSTFSFVVTILYPSPHWSFSISSTSCSHLTSFAFLMRVW